MEQYFLVEGRQRRTKGCPFSKDGIGSSAYQVLRDLVAPDAPAAKTLEELTDVLKKHY